MKLLISHAGIISPGEEYSDGAILVENGIINRIFPESNAADTLSGIDEKTDAGGAVVLPGFFDIHFHGCMGSDFIDGTADAIKTIAEAKVRQGVTSMLGTTLSLPEEAIREAIALCAAYQQSPSGANFLGIHLEGPFIAPEFAGAQNPAYLKKPDMGMIERLNRIMPVRKVSYSPELDPDCTFLRELAGAGIMPSAAHSGADYELFCKCADLGMKHITHFCNCITPLHHLRPGMVGGGLFRDDIYLELICDGIHLHPDMVKFIFKTAGCERIMLITDSMCAAGMPDGGYSLGGLPVTVKDGCARVNATGAVAGSTLLMYNALKNVVRWTGLPLKDIVGTTAWNQARSLGIGNIGKIAPGFRADMVMLDEDFKPLRVWIGGEEKSLR